MAQRQPHLLSGGKEILYVSVRKDTGASGIYLARLDGKGARRRVYRRTQYRYVSPNTLLVFDNGRLMAMTFNRETGATGEPVVVAPTETTYFGASSDGRVLALVGGRIRPDELTLYDRAGKKLETLEAASPNPNAHLEFSSDGRRLLLERVTGRNTDLWTVELARKVVSRLTFHENSESPGIWSADGQTVYFNATLDRKGEGIFAIPSNGTGTEKLVLKTLTHHLHASPDGKYLVFEKVNSQSSTTSTGLTVLDLQNGNKVIPYLTQPASSPQFSPDSRMVAYESAETGRSEVYVQTFPAGGGKWQISTNGGIEPRWRGDGKEIYYDRGDGTVMAASIATQAGSLEVTATKELFKFRRGQSAGTSLAVTKDGKLFAIREAPPRGDDSITVLLNWKLPGR